MKKALFWDFDGTLVYHSKLWTASMYRILMDLGYIVEEEQVRLHMRSGYSWHNPEISYIENTGAKWWDSLFGHFKILFEKISVTGRDTVRIRELFIEKILNCRNYNLYEDAEETLEKCLEAGYKNYIVSNNYPELEQVIKDLGIPHFFSGYIVSANLGYEKPRIEIFEYAKRLAGNPDICYMIGDNPVADIQGGRSAGMKTISVHNENDGQADHKCGSLSLIPGLLI